MSQCPRCGVSFTHDDTNAPAVEDRGGCLVTGLIGIVTVVAIPLVNWLGSLVGLHLWHWMTTPWPSIEAIARTILVFSLNILLTVLAFRGLINRRTVGPERVCRKCGFRMATAVSTSGLGLRIALSVLLAFIFVCLGLCSFGVFTPEDPGPPLSAVCDFDSRSRRCASHNATVGIYQESMIIFASCRFAYDVDWGDGTKPATATTKGGVPKASRIAEHVYKTTGTYTIVVTVRTTTGTCKLGGARHEYTYLPA